MKLLRCLVRNFVSYEELNFDFSNVGLALLYGPTGAGKSTVMDVATWCMYGVTAKDGAVDDVRSWVKPEEVTHGSLEVEVAGKTIDIVRNRGTASQNDLYWEEDNGEIKRGKDITETQKLLEKRLGVTADLYLSGAYYHEFSPASAFFVTSAKQRRAIFEKVAVLDFPVKLAAKAFEQRKVKKELVKTAYIEVSKAEGKLEQIIESQNNTREYARSWNEKQVAIILELKEKFKNFEVEKTSKIQALQLKSDLFEKNRYSRIDKIINTLDKWQKDLDAYDSSQGPECPTCGAPSKNHIEAKEKHSALSYSYKILLKDLERHKNEQNPHIKEISATNRWENYYEVQLNAEIKKINPFDKQIEELSLLIVDTEKMVKALEGSLSQLISHVASLEHIYKLSFSLRAELLKRAVSDIEVQTNSYIETYFEGEFRVQFVVNGDDLDVSITKGGYPCVYKQLSKGQRGLLKLCFVISIMKASANNAGVHFDNIFFDEALDGLDAEFKVKAYNLFECLAKDHNNVLVIDHATELKSLFSNKLKVSLVGDNSVIETDNE